MSKQPHKEDTQGATLSLAAAKDLRVEAAVEEFCFFFSYQNKTRKSLKKIFTKQHCFGFTHNSPGP